MGLGSPKLLCMDLKTWLNAERGRHKTLAAHLGASPSRMTQMADLGVPLKYMLMVRDFTAGEVSLEDMVRARTPPEFLPKSKPKSSRKG